MNHCRPLCHAAVYIRYIKNPIYYIPFRVLDHIHVFTNAGNHSLGELVALFPLDHLLDKLDNRLKRLLPIIMKVQVMAPVKFPSNLHLGRAGKQRRRTVQHPITIPSARSQIIPSLNNLFTQIVSNPLLILRIPTRRQPHRQIDRHIPAQAPSPAPSPTATSPPSTTPQSHTDSAAHTATPPRHDQRRDS